MTEPPLVEGEEVGVEIEDVEIADVEIEDVDGVI